MPSVTLRAHYNGKQVVLDDFYPLSPNAKLLVTVLPNGENSDSADWSLIAEANFSDAYGDDEPEYTSDDLTSKQKAELTRRLEDHERNPGGNFTWEKIEVQALTR